MLTTHSGVGFDPIAVHPSSVRPCSVQFSSVSTLIMFPYCYFLSPVSYRQQTLKVSFS